MQCMNDIMLMERISHEFDEKPHKSFYAKQSSYGAKVINAALHPLNLQTVLAGETLAYTNLLQEFVTSCRLRYSHTQVNTSRVRQQHV